MSTQSPTPQGPAVATASKVLPPDTARTDGLTGVASLDEPVEKKLDEIEMIGEEEAAGFHAAGASPVSAGMRYLHSSRTIHQLITDRNRAVGLYLAVASLLWTASSALLNVKADNLPRLPIETIQAWCLPGTFGVLAVLAVFAGFLLIRTRIGLIYEVAKMNVLLGLPVGRVKRVNPLSIFFIMHAIISLAGGCSAALFVYFYGTIAGTLSTTWAIPAGICITLVLLLLYVGTVLYTTSDRKLQSTRT